MSALKPFLIPGVAVLTGLAILIAWGYDHYDGWGKFVLGGLTVIAGLYGIGEAVEAREEDGP